MVVVIVSAGLIVIDRLCGGDVTPALSFTVTLNDALPAVDGVPPITPVEAFSVSPAGSDPLLTVQFP